MSKLSESRAISPATNILWIPQIYAIATFATSCVISDWAELSFKALLITMFLVSFPNLLIRRFPVELGVAIGFLIVMILSFIFKANALWILIPLTACASIQTLKILIQQDSFFKRNIWTLLGIALFAFINFIPISRIQVPYISFRDMTRDVILPGILDTDGAFHMAIVNMIRSEGIPSTGLHGTPFLQYHWLGYYVWAAICNLFTAPIFDTYYLINPLVVFPLILVPMQKVVENLGGDVRYLGLLPIVFFGSLDGPVNEWNRGFDNTYPIGLLLGLYCVLFAVQNASFLAIVMALIGAFFGKVSVGLICGMFLVLDQMNPYKRNWRQGLIRSGVLSFVSLACLFAVYRFEGRQEEGNLFEFLSFYIREGTGHGILYFMYAHSYVFLFSVVTWTLVMFHKNESVSPAKIFTIVIVKVSLFTFFIIGLNLRHSGGSQFFFLNPLQWLSLPILMTAIFNALNGSKTFRYATLVLLAVGGIWTCILLRKTAIFYANYKDNISETVNTYRALYDQGSPNSVSSEFLSYFFALRSIEDDIRFEEYAVEIPESELAFWNHSVYPGSRFWMSFTIPAFSGRPGWNAYNFRIMKNKSVAWYPAGLYGFSDYYVLANDDVCRSTPYKGLVRIQKDDTGKIQRKVLDCLAGTLTPSHYEADKVF